MAAPPLRLMIHDATCTGRRALPGLSHAWSAGGRLFGSLGRLDHSFGARTWTDALAWLSAIEPARPIGEIQFWGHGRWGHAFIDGVPLGEASLEPEHEHRPLLDALRGRLCGPEAQWWFRTCHTLGAEPGQRFAQAWSRFFGCRVAGHTYVIHVWQSGLYTLAPGERPRWSAHEGIARGTPAAPEAALNSHPLRNRTIHCLRVQVPRGW